MVVNSRTKMAERVDDLRAPGLLFQMFVCIQEVSTAGDKMLERFSNRTPGVAIVAYSCRQAHGCHRGSCGRTYYALAPAGNELTNVHVLEKCTGWFKMRSINRNAGRSTLVVRGWAS